jgi:hypothetical protein
MCFGLARKAAVALWLLEQPREFFVGAGDIHRASLPVRTISNGLSFAQNNPGTGFI